MEQVTTAAMVNEIATYLGERLAKNESLNRFLSDFTDATVKWIRPIFLKDDGTEKEVIKTLKENPGSQPRRKAVESAIEIELESSPDAIKYIEEIFKKISETGDLKNSTNDFSNSKNFNTGNINTKGGDFHIGDRN